MTTSPVMTVTDELLAELDRSVRVVWRDDDATVIAVDALTTELRRLRADNSELEQSLAESRANDQAAMGWLSAYRVAARGGDMPLPDMVSHIEGLAKDAGRYRWLRYDALNIDGWAPAAVITDGSMIQQCLEGRYLDDEIDTAMATQ